MRHASPLVQKYKTSEEFMPITDEKMYQNLDGLMFRVQDKQKILYTKFL